MAGYSPLMALNVNTGLENATAAADWYDRSSKAQVQNQTAPFQITQQKEAARQSQLKSELDQIKTGRAKEIDAIDHELMGQVEAEPQASPLAQQPAVAAAEQPAEQPAEGRIAAQPTTASNPPPEKKPTFTPEIDNAIKFFNSNPSQGAAEWDKRFTELGKTQPEAQQLVGRYGKMGNYGKAVAANEVAQTPDVVKSQLAAKPADQPSPLATASGQILSPYTGKPSAALTRRMILDPEGTTAILKAQAVGMYEKTRDPRYLQAYAPDILTTITNIDQVHNGERREQIKFRLTTTAAYAHDMIETGQRYGPDSKQTRTHYDANVDQMQADGLITAEHAKKLHAEPINWVELGASELHATTVLEDMNFKEKQSETNEVYVGNTTGDLPVYHDTKKGTDRVGTVPVVTKVGAGSNKKPVWQLKYEAALALNGGDRAAATLAANSGARMTPEYMRNAARARANEEQKNQLDPSTFDVSAAAETYYQEMKAAQEEETGSGGYGNGGAPAGGAAAPVGGGLTKSGYTQAQAQRAWTNRQQQKGSIHDPEGSIKRPWTPRNAEEFKKVKRTDWYIDGEGVLYYVDENGKHLRGGVR